MSTVSSYNQAHIDAIDNAGIASGLVDANGHVILNKKGGGTIDVGSVVAPSGSVVMFAGSITPSGWLLCNGIAVSRITYAALFAAIGTAYGAGDGTNTFNLPNMEARFPRMQASLLGGTGGAASHNHTQPTHDHQLDGGSVAAHAQLVFISTGATPNQMINRITVPAYTPNIGGDGQPWSTPSGTQTLGTKVAGRSALDTLTTVDTTSTVPPYVNFNFIIKT
jgi:microcystin-dependent protein